ncbi:Uu.00g141100.m01.CDS01 [Anthostomella pinea]|uniref:Uu.00g141100.m01.CDS01 n=1 Tax=Anthostomella pinea TaxID=933095 RepID=A0AAI8VQV7_9PEZI|nr:Uu.00g141100.m01.CDS01 [Anthostomella pinea]
MADHNWNAANPGKVGGQSDSGLSTHTTSIPNPAGIQSQTAEAEKVADQDTKDDPDTNDYPEAEAPAEPANKKRKRLLNPCTSGQKGRVGCDGTKPSCLRCAKKGLVCVYVPPNKRGPAMGSKRGPAKGPTGRLAERILGRLHQTNPELEQLLVASLREEIHEGTIDYVKDNRNEAELVAAFEAGPLYGLFNGRREGSTTP